jgi:hypothetical protein
MKYTALLFCCALIAARPSNVRPPTLFAPSQRDTLPQTLATRKAAFRFFDSILTRPSCTFIKLEPGLPEGMDTILARFNNAIASNRQWFNAYKEKYAASGQQLPYDAHFGITFKEYRRILALANAPIQLAPADSQTVTVLRGGGLVQFRSAGENHFLDYLLIDPAHQQLMYGGDTIPFAGLSDPGLANRIGLAAADTTHFATGTAPTLGATSAPIVWQGYSWRLEKTDVTTGMDGVKVAARVVQIDLGLAQGHPDPLIRIHYEQLKADSTVSNFDLIGYIH